MSELTRSEVLELRLIKPDEGGVVELRREVFHSLCNMALRMHEAEASAQQFLDDLTTISDAVTKGDMEAVEDVICGNNSAAMPSPAQEDT